MNGPLFSGQGRISPQSRGLIPGNALDPRTDCYLCINKFPERNIPETYRGCYLVELYKTARNTAIRCT